jgi:hypothetical protein
MIRFRRRTAVVGALTVALVVALVVAWQHSGSGRAEKGPTLAQLAAANYRTLTRDESQVLLRFARDEHACLSARGFAISAPVATPTRITMSSPGEAARSLARATLGCEPQVGPPPQKSSLQARPNEIVVYLPKRCLMNPHELSGA